MKTTMTLQVLESGLIKTQFKDDKVLNKIMNNFELNKEFSKVIATLQDFYTDNLAEGKYTKRMSER